MTEITGTAHIAESHDAVNRPGPRMDALRLLTSAEGFAAIADFAVIGMAAGRDSASTVALTFILAQALELAIKAWLVVGGRSLGELSKRPYSHDIERVLLEAKACGFALPVELPAETLSRLNAIYSGAKQLQYPTVDGFALASPRLLREMVAACISAGSLRIRGYEDPVRPGGSIATDAKW